MTEKQKILSKTPMPSQPWPEVELHRSTQCKHQKRYVLKRIAGIVLCSLFLHNGKAKMSMPEQLARGALLGGGSVPTVQHPLYFASDLELSGIWYAWERVLLSLSFCPGVCSLSIVPFELEAACKNAGHATARARARRARCIANSGYTGL